VVKSRGMRNQLSAAVIVKRLKTTIIGRNLVYYPTLASTMDTARQEGLNGAPNGTVILAGEQTKGRGRLKREWLSPAGNIALSIILYPNVKDLPYLIMIASLAAVKSMETVTGFKAGIKWPNDVLIEGKKAAGILIENELKGNRAVYSIIGIGINVDLKAGEYPEIADTATSLQTQSSPEDLSIKLITSLLTEFEILYVQLPDGKLIFNDWRDRLITLGQKVTATSSNQIITGTAESVDESGALTIRQPDGTLATVVSGDVTLRGETLNSKS
jgi:BirA family biotin operon repressor/biotin-[acetyl-CoA-carboxylase] ligase